LNANENVVKQLYAAFEVERRINMHRFPMQVEVKDHRVMLQGEVGSLAAKRLAARLAKGVAGNSWVVDLLRVATSEDKPDGEIMETLSNFLSRQIDLKNCTLRRRNRGEIELLHEAPHDDWNGEIEFGVDNAVVTLEGRVISLSHQRITEVLAWWVPGCRNVINRLSVVPNELDSDDEISDAVHLALEMDPLVHADQIGVGTSLAVVTLEGAVRRKEEKDMAEYDAWCVAGINDVLNHLEVVEPARLER
jgi:osmotically-inducible protein OsmY